MNKPHVLFVCSHNQWRSPTAERVYANDPRLDVRSAGVGAQATHRISEADLKWADLVLVMEHKHKTRIREMFPTMTLPPISCLDIPDDYQLMDADLIERIKAGTEFFLKEELGL